MGKPDPDPLTLAEAWAEQARWWNRTERCGCSCGRLIAAGFPNASGLCATIGIMRSRKLITEGQEEQMLAALPRNHTTWVHGVRPFLWPTDTAGALARSEFCREQARRLRKGA